MTPDQLTAIRERAIWPWTTRTSGTDSAQAFLDRVTLLAELERCAGDNNDLRERIGELEDAYAEAAAEHFREMNEAGAELREMQRELDRAEQRLEDWDVPR